MTLSYNKLWEIFLVKLSIRNSFEKLYSHITRGIIIQALNRFRSWRCISFNRLSTAELIRLTRFGGESFNRCRRVLLITFSSEADCSSRRNTNSREDAFSRFVSEFSHARFTSFTFNSPVFTHTYTIDQYSSKHMRIPALT